MTDEKLIEEILRRGVDEIIVRESLAKKLKSGRQLRVKFGIDPTGADLHIGHAVPLRKLKQFQDLGHQVILLIGDYTAMIGDPSGRDKTRPILNEKDVKRNMKTYLTQAAKIINVKKAEIRHNSEWYAKPGFAGLLMDLTSRITVARVLERDDFQKRIKEGSDIQMQEMMYPLLQGYDSVMLKADVELGGTDQKFNLLMGRKVQKKYGQPEQDIMTTPLLEGIDGERKMSKSYGNYIALLDTPDDMFGKVMSIPDSLIKKYFELATEVPIAEVEKEIKDPMRAKKHLAREIITLYHSAKAAKDAEENFVKVFQKKEKPEDIPTYKLSAGSVNLILKRNIINVLVKTGLASSNSDARRLIEQKGIKVDDKIIEDVKQTISTGEHLIQKGKRFFVRVIIE
ncbi:MAG: tyrosine--tRNA ligase [Candidatus Parcubacteria bacterium]|nr:tyrosine--tRNA ligase [Candidatus Parcubacteria bacterium]